MSILNRERLLRSTILAGFAAVTATGVSAMAQENDEDTSTPVVTTERDAPAAAPGETIVVTGSRIRRDAFTSTAPLQVIDSEDIRDAGLIDVSAILGQTSVAQGIQLDNSITSGGFVTDGGPGAQNVSLRGLSADRTLALINGRRFAPAGIGGAPSLPDTNLIPSALIQRIDILLDGASSVYGSDAVAGVINVVLRDRFEGIQADAFVNAPESSGGGQQRYSVLMGGSSDRSNYLFAVEYYSQERLRVRDRDHHYEPDSGYYCQQRLVRDASGNLNSYCSGAIINRVRRGIDFYRTPGETNLPGVVPPGWSSVVAPGVDGPTTSLLPQFTSVYMDEDTDIVPQSQRYSIFFTGDTDLNPIFGWDGINLFTEASFTNSQTIRKTDFHGQLFPAVGADNPFNPFGVNVQPILAFPVERSSQRAEIQQARLLSGLRGDLATFGVPSWDFEVFAGYTRSMGYLYQGGIDRDRLTLSLRTSRFSDPNDPTSDIICGPAGGVSPGGSFAADPCVPINLFADSLYPNDAQGVAAFATDEEREYLEILRTSTTRVDQSIAGAFVTGPILQLPAGELAGVFGVEWRRDQLDSGSDSVTGRGVSAGFSADRRSRGGVSLAEAYAELSVPILSGMTFAEDLSLELAGRVTDHEFYGQNGTYSGRLSYSPVDYLTLRGTYGTSFRAPNARELFLGGQTGFGDVADPCVVPLGARSAVDDENPDLGFAYDASQDTREQIILDNCRAEGIDPTVLGLNIRPGSLQINSGGNVGLDPETSTAYSYGFVLNQPWFNAFDATLSVNWFKIDVEDTIATPGASFALSECYNSPQFPNDPFCARRVRVDDPDPERRFLSIVDNTPFNVARREVSGMDYNARFGADLDWFGGFRLDVNTAWTWTDKILNQTTPESNITNAVGSWTNPEWRGNLTTRVSRGDWSALWRARYVGEQATIFTDTTPGSTQPHGQRNYVACTAALIEIGCYETRDPETNQLLFSSVINEQPGTFYHDLSVTYNQDTWVLRAGVNNVLNESPALIDAGGGSTQRFNMPLGAGYDLIGRSFFVNVTKQF